MSHSKGASVFRALVELVVILLLGALSIVGMAVLVGCARTASAVKDTREVVYHPRTGEMIYERSTGEHLKQQTPDAPAGPSDLMFEDSTRGGGVSTAGSHAKPLEAYGIEQRQWIFYGGGAALVLGAAVSFWLGQRMLSLCLGAAAGVLFVGPTFLDIAAPYIAATAGLLLAVGLIWAAAVIYRKHRENLSGVASALKLGSEGAALEAVAALRETPIARRVKGQE